MTTRISTAGQHAAAIAQILKQQTALSRTQVQVASGERIQSPADDPIAATRILANERTRAQLDQYGRNAEMATQRLAYAEQSFTDVTNLMQRIRELALQAGSGAMDDGSLAAIAGEVAARGEELLQIANRQDANGEYLFAGYSSGSRPFTATAGTVGYRGDQGVRQLAISSSQQVADGFSGERVFMDVRAGNGTFVVETGTHAGTGVIGATRVRDAAAWAAAAAAAVAAGDPHEYTIAFTDTNADATVDTWRVTDVDGNAVATGAYSGSAVIAFAGAEVDVSGVPAPGDTLDVRPAGTENLFATVEHLRAILAGGTGTPEANARFRSELNRALGQLDGAIAHASDLRSETGARLAALEAAAAQREQLDDVLTSSISDLRDLDYAEAISRMNQQLTGLQAAQQAYTRIGQLSLFDYLR